jgi:hypothetical protein
MYPRGVWLRRPQQPGDSCSVVRRRLSSAARPLAKQRVARPAPSSWPKDDLVTLVLSMCRYSVNADLQVVVLDMDSIPHTLEILDGSILLELDEQSVRRR